MTETLLKTTQTATAPNQIEACLGGTCDCSNASACSFTRCKNCDNPIGENGKTLVDHSCEEHETCPDCDGPLNDRRIYGAL